MRPTHLSTKTVKTVWKYWHFKKKFHFFPFMIHIIWCYETVILCYFTNYSTELQIVTDYRARLSISKNYPPFASLCLVSTQLLMTGTKRDETTPLHENEATADDSLVHLTAPSSESWHQNLFFSYYCHCTSQMMLTHSLSDSLLALQLHPILTSSSLHWKRTSSHLWKNCSRNMNARNWNWCARNDLQHELFLVSRLFVPLIFPWNVQSLS